MKPSDYEAIPSGRRGKTAKANALSRVLVSAWVNADGGDASRRT